MDDTTSTLPLLDPVKTREPSPVRHWNRLVWNNGPLLILLAAFAFASVMVAVKLLDDKIPQLQIMLFRGLIVCIAIPIKMKCLHPGTTISLGQKENLPLLAMVGCSSFCHIATLWYSITCMPIADATAIIYANTIFTAAIGLFARLENWTKYTPLGILLSVVGVVIVTKPPMIFAWDSTAWTPERVKGMEMALVSSIMLSLLFVVIKRLDKRERAEVLLFWQNLVMIIFSFVLLCLGIPHKPAFVVTLRDALATGVVILMGVTGWAFVHRGGQLSSSTLVSVLSGTELAYTLLADTFVFGEVFCPLKLLGVGFIIGASGIVAYTVTPAVS